MSSTSTNLIATPEPDGVFLSEALESSPQLLAKPNRLSARCGLSWMKQAWEIFKMMPDVWMLSILIIGMIFIALAVLAILLASVSPLLGNIANIGFNFIWLFVIAGFAHTANALLNGDEVGIGTLFNGIFSQLKNISILILIHLTLFALAAVITLVLIPQLPVLYPDLPQSLQAIHPQATFFSASVFLILLAMMMWYAPVLIALHDIKPWAAMKMSLYACWRNILPLIVFIVSAFFVFLGIAVIVGTVSAISVMMLSLLGDIGSITGILLILVIHLAFCLIYIPTMLLIYYTSYRDVWTDLPLEQTDI
ncbi:MULTISPECIES: BPSS1780 family membrane protein [unclassified Neisseria]|uniref:BPSS1780 family membrane protein n=1 Tax=unclassified Neisseria TaxID=2623750 RepID=UPI002665D0C8|nr:MULTISPECIES: BPSS1780 family membrane protein [unclassified Neisseria]MDO1510068.1 BPSS1780 family membrane protein [Neisseria sp. MVDL19-042950]MDO1516902.1 BPSS1780 family membrane protein [Neisseria sp. MVDL18-041461]MDO1564187.1 BPSS1780 family membrane protein [Neisseria sp. MVDL20-010259]